MVLSKVGWAKHVRLALVGLGASALAATALPVKFVMPAEAKTPGSTYCYHGTCHRVKTLEETQALVGVEETLFASHYDDCSHDRYNPCGLTSSGEKFHADRPDNTASPIYPDGTTLLVWSAETERALVVRVNNAGPYWGNRTLDLSRAAAEKLGFEGKGVAKLSVRVIKAPDAAESKYVENRTYPPVPGDIGQYASLAQAQTGMAVALALQATAASPMAPVTTANAFTRQDDAGMIVAEAPQSLGRGVLAQVAYVPPVAKTASLSFGDLLPNSVPQSRPRQVASLSLDRGVNQSRWGEDLAEDAAPAMANSSDITTGSIEPKRAEATPAKEQAEPAHKQVARRDENDEDEARPARSRKSQVRSEHHPRSSRTAAKPRRREVERAQLAYSMERAAPRPEWRERSAGEQMSLGIRAQSSSTRSFSTM